MTLTLAAIDTCIELTTDHLCKRTSRHAVAISRKGPIPKPNSAAIHPAAMKRVFAASGCLLLALLLGVAEAQVRGKQKALLFVLAEKQ